MESDESRLVACARQGDSDAVTQLFRRHWPAVWRAAYAVCSQRELANDAAQEAFLRAIASLRTFDDRRPIGPWLTRIAVNATVDELRRERHWISEESSTAQLPGVDWPLDDEVVRAVANLSHEKRLIIALHYWLDYETPAIAELLRLPLGTVASRLSRALSDLRTARPNMSDLEHSLKRARGALGEPDNPASDRAHRAVLDAADALRSEHRQRTRLSRRRVLAGAVAFAVAVAAAFAAGFFVASSGASGDSGSADSPSSLPTAVGPGFLPAAGWETFQTGLTAPPRAPSATAANASLGAEVFSGTFPWDTIGGLEAGEVLLQATFYPTGESAAVDEQFPARELPLSFDDAQADAPLEGQPANVVAYRLLAQVNNLNVDLFIFFGAGELTPEARAAAQEELARLVIP